MADVVVVEDHPDVLESILVTLRWGGHRCHPARDGAAGLIRARRIMPDVVLTDLAMPGMTGIELIQRLKEHPATAPIPVIAVTAYVWDMMAQAAAQAGCAAFVGKPFTPAQLLRQVERHASPSTRGGSAIARC